MTETLTIKQALKTISSYPIAENAIGVVLIERCLKADETFTQEVAKSESYELAKADVLMFLVGAANISEGGYSISVSDVSAMKSQAMSIYRKYGDSKGDVQYSSNIFQYDGDPI